MIPDPLRRQLLFGMLATLFPLPAAARQNRPICADSRVLSDPAAPLTIDVHAHVFNGTDLQIKEFLSQTVVGHEEAVLYQLARGLGGILQFLAWNGAPSARDELRALVHYGRKTIEKCGDDVRQVRAVAATAFQDGYERGREELQSANNRAHPRGGGPALLGPGGDTAVPGLAEEIAKLPETFDEFEAQASQAPPLLGSDPHLRGYIQFVLHNFNHRHVNALDYLTTYSNGSPRKVDLLIPSLVDYDWWLAKGRSPKSSLTQQVDVMARIAVLLAGRVHGFAPFCPFREAMTARDGRPGDSLTLVRRAVETEGFLGVKLYPPMGFAALGNASLDVWRNKRTLPEAAAQPGFGQRLDTAMRALFTWCQAQDVPIMAHANESNGPYPEFKRLAASEYWARALEAFPGLRVSFGHFGDTDLEDHAGDRSRSYLELMTAGAESRGAHVFSDSSYFAGVLANPQGMADVLLKLYQTTPATVLAQRLMYGTDWMMVLPQRNVERYLAEFIGVMSKVEAGLPGQPTTVADGFFGGNAVEFLGLRRGSTARQRLEAFYARNHVATPDWMRKVDRLT